MAEYFFELLLEEVPAWMMPHPHLEARLRELCAYLGLEPREQDAAITINYSPRRIAFVLRNFPPKREDDVDEVKGPPKIAAFKEGVATPALTGVLKRKGEKKEDA